MRLHRPTGVIGAALATMALATVPVAAQTTEFVSGNGSASAFVAGLGPVGDNLSFVVGYGESLSDYQGDGARALSRVVDLGLLGLLLSTSVCPGTPPPVRPGQLPSGAQARTGDPGAAQGTSRSTTDTPGGPMRAGAGREQVWATSEPGSRSATTLATAALTGVLEVTGGRSAAAVRVLKGRAREASASSEIDSVDMLGGIVHLEGLRWEAAQRTGSAGQLDRAAGTFKVARASVRGQPVDLAGVPEGRAIEAINRALVPTGLVLDEPRARVEHGALEVTPLGVRLIDSPLARATVAPALAAAQPVRQRATDAVVEHSCSAALLVQGYDIGTGTLAGNGGLVLRLGGVTATTDGTRYASPFLSPGPSAGLGPGSPAGVGGGPVGLGGLPAVGRAAATASPAPVPTASLTGVPGRRAMITSHVLPGGGRARALVVGLVGIGVLALVAILDFRRMTPG